MCGLGEDLRGLVLLAYERVTQQEAVADLQYRTHPRQGSAAVASKG